VKNYTQRFCHLFEEPLVDIGEKLTYGQSFVTMGNTGVSLGAHLHTDGILGHQTAVWRLSDMESYAVIPAPRQCAYFIDGGIFGYTDKEREAYVQRIGKEPIIITTFYCDPRYKPFGKFVLHMGYDLYPVDNRHIGITWNRSKTGTVLSKGFDKGYGYYINVGYKA